MLSFFSNASIVMNKWLFLLHWLIFEYWNSLELWDKPHLVMVYYSFLHVVKFELLIFSWGFLHLHSRRMLVCGFLSLCLGLCWLWCQSNAGVISWVWKCFLLFSQRGWIGVVLLLLYVFGRICLWNHPDLEILGRRFLTTNSISLTVIGLFGSSISSWVNLDSLCLSKWICLFHLSC